MRDAMRLIKSAEEIAVTKKATNTAGLTIIEAMRSANLGIYECQLDAATKYIFYRYGLRAMTIHGSLEEKRILKLYIISIRQIR